MVETYVPPSYEQHLRSFEKALATLVSEVSAMTREDEFTLQHRTEFGYLYSTANSRLGWTKDKIIEAFAPLNTSLVVVLDCCLVAFRREVVWADRFGAAEVITDLRMMAARMLPSGLSITATKSATRPVRSREPAPS